MQRGKKPPQRRCLENKVCPVMQIRFIGKKVSLVLKKKKQQAQGGVICSQKSKPRLNCSFSPFQEWNFKLISLEFPGHH